MAARRSKAKAKKEETGFLDALKELAAEKGVEEEVLFDAIEAALISAYKRNFGSAQNVRVVLDRQLKKPRDFVREQGKKVDVTLYAPVDGTKEFTGVLEGYDEDAKTVTIDGKAWPLENISVIRLHIDF